MKKCSHCKYWLGTCFARIKGDDKRCISFVRKTENITIRIGIEEVEFFKDDASFGCYPTENVKILLGSGEGWLDLEKTFIIACKDEEKNEEEEVT